MSDQAADDDLADLLEACLRAEHAHPGSAARIVQTAPRHLRAELEQLLDLARRVSAVPGGEPAPEVRERVRARVLSRIAPPFGTGWVGGRITRLLQTLWRKRTNRG